MTRPIITASPVDETARETAWRCLSAVQAEVGQLVSGTSWRAPAPHGLTHEVQPGVWGWSGSLVHADLGVIELALQVHEDLEHGHRVEVEAEARLLTPRQRVTGDDPGVLRDLSLLTRDACCVVKAVQLVAQTPRAVSSSDAIRRAARRQAVRRVA